MKCREKIGQILQIINVIKMDIMSNNFLSLFKQEVEQKKLVTKNFNDISISMSRTELELDINNKKKVQ